ncbi:MAG: nucleoid-associated protein [Bacteroidia bacterium]
MINHVNARLDIVSVHNVGNVTNGEDILLSKTPLEHIEPETDELLKKYFMNGFQTPEYFNFTFSNNDHSLNPLYQFAKDMFEGHSNFHTNTVHIAKHLYESSKHPMIKSGDLFVAYISNIEIDHVKVDAIGLFKSENKNNFLKLENDKQNFSLHKLSGIQIDKPDKGCLIFNTDEDEGYKVCIIDKTNKGEEAAFWKDEFLKLSSCKDEFHQTRDFLNIAKNYVTSQFTEEFEINKTEQIDLLNRSMEYFKTRDNFDKTEFEEEVFQDPAVIESFRKYDNQYRTDNEIEVLDQFDIDLTAVKKQARVFKSILKLDKNFHIYIHGNKNMIEQGVEKDGRKFYKIYYENEA